MIRILACSIITLVLLLTATGCSLGETSIAIPLIEPTGVQVNTVRAQYGDLVEEMRGTGVVVQSRIEYVHSEVKGVIKQFYVQPGDRVVKGEPLLKLDAGITEFSMLQQRLSVERTELAFIEAMNAGDEDIIRIATLSVEIERKKLERMQELKRKETLFSPIDGVIVYIDHLAPGAVVEFYHILIGIAPEEELQVSYIGDLSNYSSRLKIGMPVALHMNGHIEQGYLAEAPWTLVTEQTMQREAVLSNTLLFKFNNGMPEGSELGDYIFFSIVLSEKQDVMVIPRGALRNHSGYYFVRMIENGVLHDVGVKPGLILPTQAEIVEGISEGDQVVVTP